MAITEQQMDQEIAKLKQMKPDVRRFDAFGGDNWKKIEAQIEVLQHELDEEEIYHHRGWDDDVQSSAMDARQWLDGNEPESPSEKLAASNQ